MEEIRDRPDHMTEVDRPHTHGLIASPFTRGREAENTLIFFSLIKFESQRLYNVLCRKRNRPTSNLDHPKTLMGWD